jgi:hypothetical protein
MDCASNWLSSAGGGPDNAVVRRGTADMGFLIALIPAILIQYGKAASVIGTVLVLLSRRRYAVCCHTTKKCRKYLF